MIVLTTTTAQTVNAGQPIIFDSIVRKSNGDCMNSRLLSSGVVKICRTGNYRVFTKANIGGAAGTQANLVVSVGGVQLIETRMVSSITAATDIFNVASETVVHNCCNDFNRFSVINNGTTPVNVAPGATIIIEEVCC